MALGAENQSYQRQAMQANPNNGHMQQQQQQQQQQQKQQQQQQQQLQQHQRQPQTQRRIAPVPYTKPTCGMSYASMQQLVELRLSAQPQDNTVSVVRRNARERNRVKQVNNGFTNLRQHIPAAVVADLSNGRRGIGPGANKKLSKVNTLRMAVEYIRRLQGLLDEHASVGANGKATANDHTSSSNGSSGTGNVYNLQQQQQLQQKQQQQQQQQQLFALNYFQQQQQQQQQLGSPAGSTSSMGSSVSATSSVYLNAADHNNSNSSISSSTSSSSSSISNFYQAQKQGAHHIFQSLKLEPDNASYDEYRHSSHSSAEADDDEILEYISLWQDDL